MSIMSYHLQSKLIMTNFVKLNFYVQAIFFGAVATMLLISIFMRELIWIVFYMQLGIGVSFAITGRYDGGFKVYGFLAILNLIILWLFYQFEWIDYKIVIQLFFVITPWTLAVYFFFLSYQYYKQS